MATLLHLVQQVSLLWHRLETAAGAAHSSTFQFHHAVAHELPMFATRLFCLGAGALACEESALEMNRATTGLAFELALTEAERVEARALHDIKHGTWHFLLACFIASVAFDSPDRAFMASPTAHTHAHVHPSSDGPKRSDPLAEESDESSVASDEEEASPTDFRRVLARRDALREQASMMRTCSLAAWFTVLCLAQPLVGATASLHLWIFSWLLAVCLVLPSQVVTWRWLSERGGRDAVGTAPVLHNQRGHQGVLEMA